MWGNLLIFFIRYMSIFELLLFYCCPQHICAYILSELGENSLLNVTVSLADIFQLIKFNQVRADFINGTK